MFVKYAKIGKYELAALGLILAAVLVRIILVSQHWPMINADEGTMGLMARDIAYRGQSPVFFYDQFYMGAFQAYLGALLFHVFGASLFSLRLGLILLNALFLVSLFLLTRTLYSRSLALFTVALFVFGSYFMLEYQLHVYGGYPDILLCGTLAFLFAAYLAITSSPYVPSAALRWRLLLYAGWGLVIGLGLWSDILILPMALLSGLLILLFCWRELIRIVPVIGLFIGLVAGAYPLLNFNLSAPLSENTLVVIWSLQHNRGQLHDGLHVIRRAIHSTLMVSVPNITGNPFCPVSEEGALQDPTTAHALRCTVAHGLWSTGYFALFLCAFALALWAAWKAFRKYTKEGQNDLIARQQLARNCARLFLLVSAVLILYLFVFSNAPLTWPGTEARYLIGLWIAWPALLWPLWRAASTVGASLSNKARLCKIGSIALLTCLAVSYIVGTVITSLDMPRANADYQRYNNLAQDLVSSGITHVYTDYWTCNKLAFISQERVICGVINNQLGPSHNRDPRYYALVSYDPHAAYIYQTGGLLPTELQGIANDPSYYRQLQFDGYTVYVPIIITTKHLKSQRR
jgi:hypothetical protein